MSRRPGIGSEWFRKYGGTAYVWDSVVMNGHEMRPPRFYDSRFESVDNVRLSLLKVKRRRKALLHRDDNTSDRLRVKEAVAKAKLNLKGRDL